MNGPIEKGIGPLINNSVLMLFQFRDTNIHYGKNGGRIPSIILFQ